MQVRHRRCGIDGNARRTSQLADGLYGTVQVRTRFNMYGDVISAHGLELFDVPIGIYNHEVHIKWLLGVMRNGSEYRESKRNIGHKHTIHNVDVKPICLTL